MPNLDPFGYDVNVSMDWFFSVVVVSQREALSITYKWEYNLLLLLVVVVVLSLLLEFLLLFVCYCCMDLCKKVGVVRIELTTSWLWDTRSTDWATLPSVLIMSVFYITKFNRHALLFEYCFVFYRNLPWSLFDLLSEIGCSNY